MMAFRTLLAAAVLLGYIVWRLGRETRLRRAARRVAALPRARRPQRRPAVLADRVGRAVHRLRPRRRRAGLGADLQRAPRAPLPAARAPDANPRRRARDRDRRRRRRHRDPPRGRQPGDSRRARGRPLLALLRLGRRLRPARRLRHRRAGAGGRVDAHGRPDPAALRALPAADLGAVGGGGRVGPRALAARHRARAADPLPHARPARLGAALARHLSDAGLRARLRSAAPRRGDHGRHADGLWR